MREKGGWEKVGKGRETPSEKEFAKLHPDFEREVPFKTGNNNGATHYTADFFDRRNKTIYELDGSSHKKEKNQTMKKIYFFNRLVLQ